MEQSFGRSLDNVRVHTDTQADELSRSISAKAFTTGKNKAHPEFGVESLATELANNKWLIPNKGGVLHKELADWVAELLFYDPREHTGDRVMASWFAREGARFFDGGGGGRVGVRVL